MTTTQEEELNDQIVKCIDCGSGFVLSLEERQWYQEHSYHLPKRCPECRRRRRQGMGVANG
jgi:DNA-directed RNA polymerase subunit RPC12/RpoP